LFFSFDECRNNFLHAADSSSFFDLLECVFDNLHVSCVHFHKRTLLFVVSNPTVKSWFQKSGWVRELYLIRNFSFLSDTLRSSLVEIVVVTLLEFALQVKNSDFESLFVFFVLLLKSENLVVSFLTEALSVVGKVVQLLDLLDGVVDFTHVALVDSRLVSKLLSPHVNLSS